MLWAERNETVTIQIYRYVRTNLSFLQCDQGYKISPNLFTDQRTSRFSYQKFVPILWKTEWELFWPTQYLPCTGLSCWLNEGIIENRARYFIFLKIVAVSALQCVLPRHCHEDAIWKFCEYLFWLLKSLGCLKLLREGSYVSFHTNSLKSELYLPLQKMEFNWWLLRKFNKTHQYDFLSYGYLS